MSKRKRAPSAWEERFAGSDILSEGAIDDLINRTACAQAENQEREQEKKRERRERFRSFLREYHALCLKHRLFICASGFEDDLENVTVVDHGTPYFERDFSKHIAGLVWRAAW